MTATVPTDNDDALPADEPPTAEGATPSAEDAAPAAATAYEAAPAAAAAPAEAGAVTTPGAEPSLSPAQTAARLAELFPACFGTTPPQPLKLRIQADIQQRAPGQFSRKSLSAFLHRHTGSTAYLKGLAAAPQRVDLDGQPAGEVSEEHRTAAQQELQRRKALHEERRKAERAAAREAERAQRATQAKADDDRRDAQRRAREAAHNRREEEGQGRAERAALLRAFEASSLSRANFCALKRIDDSQLDALLAQAREERERQRQQPAQRPPAQAAQSAQPAAAARPPRVNRPGAR